MYRIRYGSMAWTSLPSCDHRMILAQAKWCLKSYALGLTLPSRFNPAETHIFLKLAYTVFLTGLKYNLEKKLTTE